MARTEAPPLNVAFVLHLTNWCVAICRWWIALFAKSIGRLRVPRSGWSCRLWELMGAGRLCSAGKGHNRYRVDRNWST